MHNLNTIITEKPGISDKIVRAISPNSFDERGKCKKLQKDIITFRPDNYDYNSQSLDIQESKRFYLTRKGFPKKYSMQIEHISEQGDNHARAVRSRINRQNEIFRKKGEREIIKEEINYYDLVRGDERYLIFDTSGSPYDFNFKGGKLLDVVTNSKDWKDMESRLWLGGSMKAKKNGGISYLARSRFFNQILAFQKLPNGEKINLDKVIAATDMDVAGAHIFLSVVEGARNLSKKYKKDIIRDDQIYRMNLSSLEPEKVLEELENLKEFDWGNAYAGKSRQIFDFLYGVSITGKLNHKKNVLLGKNKKNNFKKTTKKTNLSVGRNVILGLESLLELEGETSNENEKETYIIFEGYPDNEEIERRIQNGDYYYAKTNKKKTGVGQANFIERLKEKNIGTHTTRYTLPSRFEKLGLANINKKRIESTVFGKRYYSELEKLLNSKEKDFSLDKANKSLSHTMNYLKNLDKQKTEPGEIESRFRGYISSLLPSLKKHLTEVSSESEEIVSNIIKEMDEYLVKPKKSSNKEKDKTPDNSYEPTKLIGNDKVLPKDFVSEIIDPWTNEPVKTTSIERYSLSDMNDRENMLANICCIDSGYDFQLYEGKGIDLIENSDQEDYTVFKTSGWVDIDDLPHSIEGMGLEMPHKDEKEKTAHEPLDMENPSFGMMKGREGFLLAQEYQRPWDLTFEKNAIINNGGFNVQSFKINQDKFERVERYKYSNAHNFESALSAMIEKYGLQFKETAKLMEDLYLHSD